MRYTIMVLLLIAWPLARADEALTAKADLICSKLLQPETDFSAADYSANFAQAFRSQVSLEEIKATFAELSADGGRCTAAQNINDSIKLATEKSLTVILSYRLDAAGRFSSLQVVRLEDPRMQIRSWSDVRRAFEQLDSNGRLSAALVSNEGAFFSEDGHRPLAIGSTFKLYVLGALHQAISHGQHTWNEKLALREDWKSLPSGKMQDLPAGTAVPLFSYAKNMISISDNTAADHLLYFLGRTTVEKMFGLMGNRHATLDTPLLSTLEMFKLKWAIPAAQTQSYIAASTATKRRILENISAIPRNQVGTNGVSLALPTAVDRIEWFASNADLCRAMFWLAQQNSPELRTILSTSVPLVSPGIWSYAGYKGGSEPGVVNMTYLLEKPSGKRACLSVSWNNSNRSVSEFRFFDLVYKLLVFTSLFN